MPAARKRRVAILGGGMAGLTAAWSLSEPEARDDVEICVFERAASLGGKGASTRGIHGRIEEHGLHVWLGYYENAFRLIRAVYDELDRPVTDPACPIASWRDAFAPADLVGVGDRRDGSWSHWVAAFGRNDGEPGDGAAADGPLSVVTFVRRGLGLLLDFSDSIGAPAVPPGASGPARVVLSGSPVPPRPDGSAAVRELGELLRRAEIAALVGAIESIRMLRAGVPRGGSLATLVLGYLDRIRTELLERVRRDTDAARSAELADMVISALQGVIADGLLTDPAGFAVVDHLDFRDWLARHGARPETLASPLIRGMYDLVFAYEDGDPGRPRFPAGLGLFLAGKLFFEYRGSIFWQMQAGMGDVVFAPLYQALRARGVRFRLRHRVARLRLSGDRESVAEIVLRRPAGTGVEDDPLVRVLGLPCFPSTPRSRPIGGSEDELVLTAGEDFDDVVLATSLGPLRSVCAELVDDSPRWRAMVDGLATVPTQSLQVWLREDERALGWRWPGATVSAYATPFDTYASMSHLIAREAWPAGEQPLAIGYFCSVLPRRAADDAVAAHRLVRANALEFLESRSGGLWPGAAAADGGFRWELLCGADGAVGPRRLDSQYWRANVDPSEHYVQALPGTGDLRLRADASGYGNLVLAGDWIDSGLGAGCIEAAVLAGLQAANAVRGRPRSAGVAGSWIGLGAA